MKINTAILTLATTATIGAVGVINSARAVSMCMTSGSYVVMIFPDRNGTGSTTDGANWTVTFDYNTSNAGTPIISGTTTCNELVGTTNTPDSTDATSNTQFALSSGANCWCRMKKPLASSWIFLSTYASESACTSGCASACANLVSTSESFRRTILGAIW